MKKVLIALERSKFNYLYKYDTCHVSPENIIGNSLEEVLDQNKLDSKSCAEKIEISLPIFEQEHEVLLIEYLRERISYNSGIELSFDGVIQIIPLNEMARELLSIKMNTGFKISESLPRELYENVTLIRQDKIRHRTGLSLIESFSLPRPNESFVSEVKKASSYKILEKKIEKESSSLFHLLDFDTTSSFIPEGNIEGLIKLACVGMSKAGREVSLVQKGRFYDITTSKIDIINNGSLIDAYENLEKIIADVSDEDKDKFKTLKKELNKGIEENTFLIYYLFFSFKKELQKNGFNISVLAPEISQIKKKYSSEVANALYLIGYTLSMSSLYESIHKIRRAPIFGFKFEESISENPFKGESNCSTGETESNTQYPEINEEIINQGLKQAENKKERSSKENDEETSVNPLKGENKTSSSSTQPSLFSMSNPSINEQFLKLLNENLKGKGRKEIIEILIAKMKNKDSLALKDIEDCFQSNSFLLKKDGNFIKPAQEAIDIFNENFNNIN